MEIYDMEETKSEHHFLKLFAMVYHIISGVLNAVGFATKKLEEKRKDF